MPTGSVHLWGSATHDFFPAYEFVVNGEVVHEYYPTSNGPNLLNLSVGKTYSIDVMLDSTGHVVKHER